MNAPWTLDLFYLLFVVLGFVTTWWKIYWESQEWL